MKLFTTSLAALGLFALGAQASHSADLYKLDASHSQIVFNYQHLGFSTTYSMFSGFDGEIMFDEAHPNNSSVKIDFDADTLITGWDARTKHLLSDDFFGAEANPKVSFVSTKVHKYGDGTAHITGDLTINGMTKSIIIDAKLNKSGEHPVAKAQSIGFSGTTTLKRTEFDMGQYAPYVGDEVSINIEIEAQIAK